MFHCYRDFKSLFLFFFLLQFNLLNAIMTSYKCFLFLMENNNGTEKVTEKKFSQCFLSMAYYKLETTACKWYTSGGTFYCNEDCKQQMEFLEKPFVSLGRIFLLKIPGLFQFSCVYKALHRSRLAIESRRSCMSLLFSQLKDCISEI